MPIGRETNETMFQAEPFDVDSYSRMCRQLYQGSRLRPNWITTYYGGHVSILLHTEACKWLDIMKEMKVQPLTSFSFSSNVHNVAYQDDLGEVCQ